MTSSFLIVSIYYDEYIGFVLDKKFPRLVVFFSFLLGRLQFS